MCQQKDVTKVGYYIILSWWTCLDECAHWKSGHDLCMTRVKSTTATLGQLSLGHTSREIWMFCLNMKCSPVNKIQSFSTMVPSLQSTILKFLLFPSIRWRLSETLRWRRHFHLHGQRMGLKISHYFLPVTPSRFPLHLLFSRHPLFLVTLFSPSQTLLSARPTLHLFIPTLQTH